MALEQGVAEQARHVPHAVSADRQRVQGHEQPAGECRHKWHIKSRRCIYCGRQLCSRAFPALDTGNIKSPSLRHLGPHPGILSFRVLWLHCPSERQKPIVPGAVGRRPATSQSAGPSRDRQTRRRLPVSFFRRPVLEFGRRESIQNMLRLAPSPESRDATVCRPWARLSRRCNSSWAATAISRW